MSTIFISIASYRDPELLPTLRNCLETASNPQDLRFCIAWQHSAEDVWDSLADYSEDPRFEIMDIDYRKSKGVCWARNEIQKRYRREGYYLQLDSHHRFCPGWDDTLKDYLHYLEVTGHEKPILSAYLPPYSPGEGGRCKEEVFALNIDRFLPQGIAFLTPQSVRDWRNMSTPFASRFISAHFIFTRGAFVDEVPYDPELYFHGEESSLTVRAFTHGYDLFSPHRPIIWHEYLREGKKKHWDDNADWGQQNQRSYARYRQLLGMEETAASVSGEIEKFGFGAKRTLTDYEKYAGLRFRTRQIHRETLQGLHPPIKSEYEGGLAQHHKVCVDILKKALPEDDYDLLVVALLDKDGADLFRKDCSENEIRELFKESPNDAFIHIWRTCYLDARPYASRVWPHSRAKGWMDRIEQVIPYE